MSSTQDPGNHQVFQSGWWGQTYFYPCRGMGTVPFNPIRDFFFFSWALGSFLACVGGAVLSWIDSGLFCLCSVFRCCLLQTLAAWVSLYFQLPLLNSASLSAPPCLRVHTQWPKTSLQVAGCKPSVWNHCPENKNGRMLLMRLVQCLAV